MKMIKSIVCTYPDFRMLPKGLKQLLVASENIFFSEVQVSPAKVKIEPANASLWPMPQVPFASSGYAAFGA